MRSLTAMATVAVCLHLLSWRCVDGAAGPLPPAERAALVDFYNATNGPSWSTATGWSSYSNPSNDPCLNSWAGIACSGTTPNHVTYVLAF